MKHASMLFLCLLESTNFDALLYFFFFEKYVIKFRAKIYCKQGCITCCMFLCVKILERHLSRTNLKKISVKFLTLTFGCITCCMLLCVKILERHLSRTNLKKTSVKFLTFLSLSLSLYITCMEKLQILFSLSLSPSSSVLFTSQIPSHKTKSKYKSLEVMYSIVG